MGFWLMKLYGHADARILDCSRDTWRGEGRPAGSMATDRGAFLDPASLRKVFSAAGLDRYGELITYCTIGSRASTAWFVLTHLLGRDHVRVYDGSWAEWGKMPGTPVKAA